MNSSDKTASNGRPITYLAVIDDTCVQKKLMIARKNEGFWMVLYGDKTDIYFLEQYPSKTFIPERLYVVFSSGFISFIRKQWIPSLFPSKSTIQHMKPQAHSRYC